MTSARQWLDEHADRLAEAITDEQFRRRPEWATRFGAAGRSRCTADARYHLSYLGNAVEQHAPELFVDYVAWARVLLANLKIGSSDLADNLACVAAVLEAEAPEAMRVPLLSVLERARAALPTMADALPTLIAPDAPLAGLARRYLDLLLAGDRRRAAAAILEAVEGGAAVRDVYMHVFQPCLREVGRLWQTNAITVAHEHYCTAATQLVMSQLYPRIFSTPRLGRAMVATCIEGDLHEVGVRMVADFFELEGWDAHYLGANVPVKSVVSTLAERAAGVLAISATLTPHIARVRGLIDGVRAARPDVYILVGGYPFNASPGLWREVGADGHAVDADAAVAVARGLP